MNADGGAVLDVFLEAFDITVAIRTFAEHDCGAVHFIDVRRVEERFPHHLNMDFRFLAEVAHLREFLDGPVSALGVLRVRAAANVCDTEALPDLYAFGGGGSFLAP